MILFEFYISTLKAFVFPDLQEHEMAILIEFLEEIIICWVPTIDETSLAARFSDGSSVPVVEVKQAFGFLESLMDLVQICNHYNRLEAIATKLAQAELLYWLPGEGSTRDSIISMRHSLTGLSQSSNFHKGIAVLSNYFSEARRGHKGSIAAKLAFKQVYSTWYPKKSI